MIIKYSDVRVIKNEEGKTRVIYNNTFLDWNEDSNGNWFPFLNGERVYFDDVPDTAESFFKDNAWGNANDPEILKLQKSLKIEIDKLEKYTAEKKAEIKKINDKYKDKIDSARKRKDNIELMIAKRVIALNGLHNVLKLTY